MNVNIYNIVYNKLAEWHVPRIIRQPRLIAFVKLLVTPFVFIYQDVLRFRTARLYELMITPQKCWLERLLNDRYDFTARGIYIDDGFDKTPPYIFQNAELKPKYIRQMSEAQPVWIYTGGESGNYLDDFIIYVPMAVVFEEPEMISLVKVYKLAGTKFKIQRF